MIKGDANKFKQIVLNLILQTLSGTYKGSLKIKTETATYNNVPHLRVEIENLKPPVSTSKG